MKILLLGADGQVGHELRRALAPLGELVASTLTGRLPDGGVCEPADFSTPESLAALVERVAPDWVVNAAAYTAVDRAEDEPELAYRINAEAVAVLARCCAARDIAMVHYSTDYVFDGAASTPYREDHPAGPLGVYGASKWAGEQALRDSGAQHLLFRLCWVYGAHGANFMKTMLRLAAERERIGVVADQLGTPTPAHWIANVTAQALQRKPDACGTWHLAADGGCSWYDFAAAIFERAPAFGLLARAPQLDPLTSADYPTRARRPGYSRLAIDKLERDFGIRLPAWAQGLDETLAQLATQKKPPAV